MAHFKEPDHMFLRRIEVGYDIWKKYLREGRIEEAEKAYEFLKDDFMKFGKYLGPWKSRQKLNLSESYSEEERQKELEEFLKNLDEEIEEIRKQVRRNRKK